MHEKLLFCGVLVALFVVHLNPGMKKQAGVVLASLLFLSYVACSMNASDTALPPKKAMVRASSATPVYYYENTAAAAEDFVSGADEGEDGPLQDVVGLRAPPARFSAAPSQVDFYKDQLGAPEDRGKGLALTRGYSGYMPTQFTSEPEMAW